MSQHTTYAWEPKIFVLYFYVAFLASYEKLNFDHIKVGLEGFLAMVYQVKSTQMSKNNLMFFFP